MHRSYCIGRPGQLQVLRLYTRGSAEERAMQLAVRHRGSSLEPLFVGGGSPRMPLDAVRLLEDVLRWGLPRLFGIKKEQQQQQLQLGDDSAMQVDDAGDSGGRRADYPDDQLRALLQQGGPAVAAEATAAAAAEGGAASAAVAEVPLDAPLDLASLRTWREVEGPLGEDRGAASPAAAAAPDGSSDAAAPAADELPTTDGFWEGLLRLRWEQLQREDEASAALRRRSQADGGGGGGGGGGFDADGDEGGQSAEDVAGDDEYAGARGGADPPDLDGRGGRGFAANAGRAVKGGAGQQGPGVRGGGSGNNGGPYGDLVKGAGAFPEPGKRRIESAEIQIGNWSFAIRRAPGLGWICRQRERLIVEEPIERLGVQVAFGERERDRLGPTCRAVLATAGAPHPA